MSYHNTVSQTFIFYWKYYPANSHANLFTQEKKRGKRRKTHQTYFPIIFVFDKNNLSFGL